MASEQNSQQAFFGVSALLFVVCAALTIFWCASMSRMGDMPMPGGWTMSMTWMGIPGQTWPVAAASFLGMWVAMMVAMMLPALFPVLWRYHHCGRGTGGTRSGRLSTLAGLGYFIVWTLVGMAVFPLGVALATIEMQQPEVARAVPIAAGVVVVMAGMIQFSKWKARYLACCRETLASARADICASNREAWRHGLRLGVHCVSCCGNLMSILLVIGVMDVRVMAAVTAAISFERLAPGGERTARAIGVLGVGAGLLLIARGIPSLL